MLVLTLFTLGNSTDAFLLLKLTDVAGSAHVHPADVGALHVVKAGVSIVGGSWSDRIGRRAVIALGWLVYAVGLCRLRDQRDAAGAARVVSRLRLLFRLRRGHREGAGRRPRACRSRAASRSASTTPCRASARSPPASSSGCVWNAFGAAAAFGVGAALALVATALLFVVVRPGRLIQFEFACRRILVTNDDGYRSEGIHALAEALAPLGDVTIVAPIEEASAIGHALTLRRPLRLETHRATACYARRRHADRLREHRRSRRSSSGCPISSSPASTRAGTSATT